VLNLKKELFCHVCDDYKAVDIVKRNEVYNVKDEKVEIEAEVCICKTCGEELFDKELDELNIERAFEKYRKKHGLLSPSEIKAIRETYRLSQRAFSKLLKWGEITMNRYEMGAIQDKAHNNTLILLKNPKNMIDILDNNIGVLSPSKEKALRQRITELMSENAVMELEHYIIESVKNKNDIYTGFKYLDFEKFKSLVIFFALNEEKLFKTKLMKLLYYADNIYFSDKTTSITGMQYACLPRGPVIENRNLLLGLLERQGIISIVEDDETNGEYIISEADSSDIYLDEEELEVAKQVSDRFKSFNCTQISEYSHKEKGWKETNIGSLISYDYAKYITLS
jgi:putative zinc finger/helix-turn-helix YgiT family protein